MDLYGGNVLILFLSGWDAVPAPVRDGKGDFEDAFMWG